MSLTPEGQRKLEVMKTLAESAYRDTSILEDAVTVEPYNEVTHRDEFFQLPYRTIMEREWFDDPTYVMDLVFGEIGRGIAYGEHRILVEELGRMTTAIPERRPLISVLSKISELVQSGYEPSLIFAPIDYYMDAYTTWLGPQMRITSSGGHPFLELGQQARLRIVWSGKLVPFTDFFVLDRNWARWIVKERFNIEVRPNSQLDTIFKTVYRLEIAEGAEAVRRISSTTRDG
jgi:hypothetical protein